MDLVNHLLLAIFALISFKKMLSASTICAMDRTCCLNYNWNPVFKTCKEDIAYTLPTILQGMEINNQVLPIDTRRYNDSLKKSELNVRFLLHLINITSSFIIAILLFIIIAHVVLFADRRREVNSVRRLQSTKPPQNLSTETIFLETNV
ncbi:uncharacterized protein LOC134279624 isoform X1 [Saccostrea cucullata]|uniref:uncharacterized protein LOC134279624 isoform X1 n=1 Tax=Saccostrea cuccullata TaxID=36930 RepID=UPI002ED649CB